MPVQHDPASERYFQRYCEADVAAPLAKGERWEQVLVIPCYRESTTLLHRLKALARVNKNQRHLIILVLNRPDSDDNENANQALRDAICALPSLGVSAKQSGLYQLGAAFDGAIDERIDGALDQKVGGALDLYCLDLELTRGPLPSKTAVGLARKLGCDLAWLWWYHGKVISPWIHCSDADVTWPSDYFSRLSGTVSEQQSKVSGQRSAVSERLSTKVAAAIFPFYHRLTPTENTQAALAINQTRKDTDSAQKQLATVLYELRLHCYQLGLQAANSPYAFHSLGSTIAVSSRHYAAVRGFPLRAAGEDFYLLNKLAKTGEIIKLSGRCLGIATRVSTRVPFGTGPAVAKILATGLSDGVDSGNILDTAIFYHPALFYALKQVIKALNSLSQEPDLNVFELLHDQFHYSEDRINKNREEHRPEALNQATKEALLRLGIEKALDHCRGQSNNPQSFLRHFHQWFDGFKCLKFIHYLRDSHYTSEAHSSDKAPWGDLSLTDLCLLEPDWLLDIPGNRDAISSFANDPAGHDAFLSFERLSSERLSSERIDGQHEAAQLLVLEWLRDNIIGSWQWEIQQEG